MRAQIMFPGYTIDGIIRPSCATESDFTVNITTGVGPQGYTPKRGIDYWTDEDKNTVIAQAETVAADAAEPVAADTAKNTANAILSDPAYKASIKGDKGDTGDPGYTPKRGIDYWTEADKEEIVAEATPERGVDYWTAADQQAIAAEAQSTAEAAAEATATEILNDPEYKASIKGDKGDTGYTPVRGVDYWTDADKQIVSTQAEEAAEATAATMLSDPEYKASIKGDPGEPGYTPIKGVDYFDGQDGQPGRDGQDGAPGQDGQDGVSPTITVADITGGHRVTITDADGAHSFDVMDGEDGGAVQDVQVNGVSVLQDGVANVPLAGTDGVKLGVVALGNSYGLNRNASGRVYIVSASSSEIKNGVIDFKPVIPMRQHESTFYGLAKAAGDTTQSASSNAVGTYTDEAKVAIQKMLGVYQAPWELIREDTFTNDTEEAHTIAVDGNGESFELTDVILMFETPKQNQESKKGDYGSIALNDGTSDITTIYCNAWTQAANSAAHGLYVVAQNFNGMLISYAKLQQTSTNMAAIQMRYGAGFNNDSITNSIKFGDFVIRKVRIPAVTGTGHYKLYGKRKWQ